MPRLKRPDGVEIEWRERGSGPLVAIAPLAFAPPYVLQGLIDELSSDHRVLDYDLRGSGDSSRRGPYELPTDTADMAAVLEAAGGDATVVAIGDGAPRAVRIGSVRPELVRALVVSGQSPLGVTPRDADALSLSGSVLDALIQMYEVDPRAAIRTVVTTGDPTLSEDAIRERIDRTIAYCSQESMAPRLDSWRRDDALEHAQAMGDRLWIQAYPGNPWFPIELLESFREQLPEAHIEEVEDGAMNRPDLAAATVRRITGP